VLCPINFDGDFFNEFDRLYIMNGQSKYDEALIPRNTKPCINPRK
jgi:hypothetical protein